MSKQYNLSTTDDNGQSVTTSQTVTEHPEEILRLMKLAGLENAQVVAEDESVYEPTPANDKLDLDDYSKKSPESINKQKKSIQPTLGDNPLEYSLDENEIYEAMMEEFDKTEEVTEAQSPAQKAAFAKMLAAKNPKKEEAVEETEETTEEKVEENLEKAQEEIDELKEELISEDCGCGHGSDCDCGPECDCGCNAVKESNQTEENTMSEAQLGIEDQDALETENYKVVVSSNDHGIIVDVYDKHDKQREPLKSDQYWDEDVMEGKVDEDLAGIQEDERTEEAVNEEDNTKLQRAIQTNFGENGEGDSDYEAHWPDYMNNKDVIVAIFGRKVPKTIFDAFNKHKAYSKNDEVRTQNKEISSERNNHAPYYPENKDEEILADLGLEVRDAIVRHAEDIGIVSEEVTIQDAVNESQERLRNLINW